MVHSGMPDVRRSSNEGMEEEIEEETEEELEETERKWLNYHAAQLSLRFGHIPGVKIGTTWNNRTECSLAGVHLPREAGIHGRKAMGAYSIAVSCHYNDEDLGDTIIYTGAGGRERWTDGSDGNPPKRLRLGPQIYDQSLDHPPNKTLVISRDTGKPVRVVRSCKVVSDYAPLEGYRYDGLYTVEDAWKEKNPQGLDICRFKLERVPGQPPIPLRSHQDPEWQTRKTRSKKSSSISVDTPSITAAAATAPQLSPVQSPAAVAPPPVAFLTPLQRHKQRVMQEMDMEMLEQLMGQGSSKRRL